MNVQNYGGSNRLQEQVEFWLPPILTGRISVIRKKLLISPLVFLRKAVGIHEANHTQAEATAPRSPDQELLTDAYKLLQLDEGLRLTYELGLDVYMLQLEEARRKQATGQHPERSGFKVVPISLFPAMLEYVDSQVSGTESPGVYTSAQAFGIVASHELVTLYTITDPPRVSSHWL